MTTAAGVYPRRGPGIFVPVVMVCRSARPAASTMLSSHACMRLGRRAGDGERDDAPVVDNYRPGWLPAAIYRRVVFFLTRDTPRDDVDV